MQFPVILYNVFIHTGLRDVTSCDLQVSLNLIGQQGDTGIRRLGIPVRRSIGQPLFQTGEVFSPAHFAFFFWYKFIISNILFYLLWSVSTFKMIFINERGSFIHFILFYWFKNLLKFIFLDRPFPDRSRWPN